MAVSYATYERLALEDGGAQWELVCGRLRERPRMSQVHNSLAYRLMAQLVSQIDASHFELRMNAPTLQIFTGTYLSPDVAVVPNRGLTDETGLENYDEPLPFVAEVWSPSTGSYDVDTKFPEYKKRGDREIWRVHPYERTVIAWRRQSDGSYSEATYLHGEIPVESLPGVTIRVESLFQ